MTIKQRLDRYPKSQNMCSYCRKEVVYPDVVYGKGGHPFHIECIREMRHYTALRRKHHPIIK